MSGKEEVEVEVVSVPAYQKYWHRLCTFQFVLACLSCMVWFNYNVALDFIGMFFVLVPQSDGYAFDATKLNLLFFVAFMSMAVDYAWVIANFGTPAVYATSNLAYLTNVYQISWVFNVIHLALKHVYVLWLRSIREKAVTEALEQ